MPETAAPSTASFLTNKVGGVPMWTWAAAGGATIGGILWWKRRNAAATAAAASQTSSAGVPTAATSEELMAQGLYQPPNISYNIGTPGADANAATTSVNGQAPTVTGTVGVTPTTGFVPVPSQYQSGGYMPSTPGPFTINGVQYAQPNPSQLQAALSAGSGLFWLPSPGVIAPLPSNAYFLGSGYDTFIPTGGVRQPYVTQSTGSGAGSSINGYGRPISRRMTNAHPNKQIVPQAITISPAFGRVTDWQTVSRHTGVPVPELQRLNPQLGGRHAIYSGESVRYA